jgi:hypothetical protein
MTNPYDGHRFGLESPTGSRRVRGPTLFILLILAAVALGAIVRTLA